MGLMVLTTGSSPEGASILSSGLSVTLTTTTSSTGKMKKIIQHIPFGSPCVIVYLTISALTSVDSWRINFNWQIGICK
jgi:hypothetical protein